MFTLFVPGSAPKAPTLAAPAAPAGAHGRMGRAGEVQRKAGSRAKAANEDSSKAYRLCPVGGPLKKVPDTCSVDFISWLVGFGLRIEYWGLSGLGFTIEEWLLSVFFGLIPLRPKCIMSVDGFGVSSSVAADSVEGRLLGAS